MISNVQWEAMLAANLLRNLDWTSCTPTRSLFSQLWWRNGCRGRVTRLSADSVTTRFTLISVSAALNCQHCPLKSGRIRRWTPVKLQLLRRHHWSPTTRVILMGDIPALSLLMSCKGCPNGGDGPPFLLCTSLWWISCQVCFNMESF